MNPTAGVLCIPRALDKSGMPRYFDLSISLQRFAELSVDEQQEISSELEDWKLYMEWKDRQRITINDEENKKQYPPVKIRQIILQEKKTEKENSECEDESLSKQKSETKFQMDWNQLQTDEERAVIERLRGNEYFKNEQYQKAIIHYSNSINIRKQNAALNNRAMANIKLQKYDMALKDLNEVLDMDPNNVKALYRRALCSYHCDIIRQAYLDVKRLLQVEPNNIKAKELYRGIKSNPISYAYRPHDDAS